MVVSMARMKHLILQEMTVKESMLAACLIVSSLGALTQPAHAEGAGKFSLETGLDYNTGKYGGTQSTDIWYVPVTGKYQGELWTLKLIVPYIQISGPGNVIMVNGAGLTGAVTANPRPTRSGLGDAIASATRTVYTSPAAGFIANLTGKIKFGTASAADGLGTGQNDYAFQNELYKITGDFTTFGTIGYRVYGSPRGFAFNNVFYGSLGVSYKFSPETSGGLLWNGGERITNAVAARSEALAFVSHKLGDSWKVQGYLLRGFTNSVPDWGAGATVAYVF
jgi:hypothetical protein